MISNLENAMAKQTEQATVQATGMESINNGMKPQGIATPDSNCSSINEKETSIGDPEQPVLKTDKKTPVPINDNGACDIKETGAGSGDNMHILSDMLRKDDDFIPVIFVRLLLGKFFYKQA